MKHFNALSGARSSVAGFALVLLLLLLSGCDVSGAGYVVTGPPTITAKKIDQVLCAAGSPACGTGATLYQLGIDYGIDPIFALAWFKHESTYGTSGVARATLSLGNIECSAGYACIDGFRAYSSWAAGYEDWYRLIKNLYVTQWHLTTVDAILSKYAPEYNDQGRMINDTPAYINDVEQSVDAWRSEEGGAA
jgi:hypothetical protein